MGFLDDIMGLDLTNGGVFLATMQFIACLVCIAIVLVETFKEHTDLRRQIVFPIVFLYIAYCVYKYHKRRMFLKK